MDITPANLQGLDTAFQTAFNERLTGSEVTWSRVAMRVPSTTKSNTYPRLDAVPAMREWLGDRVINRLGTSGFQVVNRKFENTVAIPRDDIEDDQYGIYSPLMADMGQASAELPDELVWPQLASGFDTVGHDGQFFFDTDHPVVNANGVEVSVSNFGGGSGTPWYLIDTSRVIMPIIFQDREAPSLTPKTKLTDDNVFHQDEFLWGARRRCEAAFGAWQLAYGSKQTLDATNYSAARAAMQSMTGDKGRKLNLRPRLLVVPPSLEGAARQLLEAERDNNGATNVWKGTAQLHVENRL